MRRALREFGRAARLEGENGVLLGGNGRPVAGGWVKVPVFQRRKAPVVDHGAKALQDGFSADFSSFVNRNFDDDLAFRLRPLPRVDHRIGSRNGQRWMNLIAVHRPTRHTSIGKASLRAVAEL